MAIIQPIFPINIWKENYKDKLSDDVINFVKNQDWIKNINGDEPEAIVKVRNSRSSDRYILENEVMSSIKYFIELNVNEYAKNVLGYKDVDFYITQSWGNKNELNECHHKHNHPNSIISGVFYICCDDNSCIKFFKDFDLIRTIHINKNQTEYNQDIVRFYPEAGDLLIFPSMLTHSVSMNNSNVSRISVSFNTFVHGTLGDEVSLNELEL
jgi:uncharacterized protein (TIGR02466 family)